MTRLIVNADDFGQTQGINRAVLELHRAGLLTSATPTLGVGCHIVLTDGEPVLPPAQIRSLIDPLHQFLHPEAHRVPRPPVHRPYA